MRKARLFSSGVLLVVRVTYDLLMELISCSTGFTHGGPLVSQLILSLHSLFVSSCLHLWWTHHKRGPVHDLYGLEV